ncbi:CBS domain-containing protein [Haloactinopolyspora sp.]|uniref:CBS domain-containing protein n=1 Tax=Haloactinopolyspora sp. TaxID=1966353 RepID=UPI0026336C99|nr:CBS domain-containing protein [Haloactinopolyspora sp.]
MAPRISEMMTDRLVTVGPDDPVTAAAAAMREHDIGDVLVTEDRVVRGVITDRDVAVRVVASGLDPASTAVRDIASGQVVSVRPDEPVASAVKKMREHAVRRLPVVDDDGRAVGVITIGDLASYDDPDSALSDVSTATPNE